MGEKINDKTPGGNNITEKLTSFIEDYDGSSGGKGEEENVVLTIDGDLWPEYDDSEGNPWQELRTLLEFYAAEDFLTEQEQTIVFKQCKRTTLENILLSLDWDVITKLFVGTFDERGYEITRPTLTYCTFSAIGQHRDREKTLGTFIGSAQLVIIPNYYSEIGDITFTAKIEFAPFGNTVEFILDANRVSGKMTFKSVSLR